MVKLDLQRGIDLSHIFPGYELSFCHFASFTSIEDICEGYGKMEKALKAVEHVMGPLAMNKFD